MPIEPCMVRHSFGKSIMPVPVKPTQKPYDAWDEANLADAMRKTAKQEGHRGAIPKSMAELKERNARGQATRAMKEKANRDVKEKRNREYSAIMVRLLTFLRIEKVERGNLVGIFGNSGNTKKKIRQAFEMEWIVGGNGQKDLIGITDAGIAALAAMRKEPQ